MTHTPGAIRAGQRISAILKRYFPLLPPSNADTLAAIIDEETAAPELLEALKAVMNDQIGGNPDMDAPRFVAARAAIAKAEGKV